jgi:hypothetical protein
MTRSGVFTLHGISANITALLLAAHMMLGCCWHHAHTCAAGCGQEYSKADNQHDTTAKSHDCCGDHQSDGQKHGPQNCKGLPCIFIVSTSTKNIELGRLVLPAVFAPLPHNCTMPVVTPQRGTCLAGGDLSLNIRPHLVHQVLLI